MSLVFATIIPHSTATVLRTGAEQPLDPAIERTRAALKELEGELYVMQPDTMFVVSPHAAAADQSFSVNLAADFTCTYRDFGDEATSVKLGCDIEMVSKIREYADRGKKPLSVNIVTQPVLDYGTSLAVYHLTQHLPAVKLVPISLAQLSLIKHFEFGEALRHIALQSNKRIALVVTAELGHTSTATTTTFTKMVLDAIKTGDLSLFPKINLEVIESAQAIDEFKALMVLAGALAGVKVQPKILAQTDYQGHGLVVAQFHLI